MSRAALYVFGLGTVTLTGACGGQVSHNGKDGGEVGGDSSSVTDAPTPPEAGSMDTGNFAVPYGLPADVNVPPIDAGGPVDAADATIDIGAAPPYGAPPPQDE
jgi:hypothetical protein